MTREQLHALFDAELKRLFGVAWGCHWEPKIQRTVVTGRSATGRPTAEPFGWFYDPNRSYWDTDTMQFRHPVIEADPETGLPPYRELDRAAMREIIEAMEKTYVARRDGPGNWGEAVKAAHSHNDGLYRKRVKQKAEDIATILSEVDLRRPYLKMHSGPQRSRRIARNA